MGFTNIARTPRVSGGVTAGQPFVLVGASAGSRWGVDAGGQPYFNDAGVSSTDVAILSTDASTGDPYLVR